MVRHRTPGFTLLELTASAAVFSVILLVIFVITQSTGNAWRKSRSSIEAFQGARIAFETMTSLLGQATLNTYYDYFDGQGRSSGTSGFAGPQYYGRQSDLHFISGKTLLRDQVTHAAFFQVPFGYVNRSDPRFRYLHSLLNVCGFYVYHGPDPVRPDFLQTLPHPPPNPSRYRLMQLLQPGENMSVYSVSTNSAAWFRDVAESSDPPVQQLAENVVALVFLPRQSVEETSALAPDYEYDSRAGTPGAVQPLTQHQLPPLMEVVLIAVDEVSAQRIEEQRITLPQLFEKDSAKLDEQLKEFETFLVGHGLIYRLFRAIVPLHNSKWSS